MTLYRVTFSGEAPRARLLAFVHEVLNQHGGPEKQYRISGDEPFIVMDADAGEDPDDVAMRADVKGQDVEGISLPELPPGKTSLKWKRDAWEGEGSEPAFLEDLAALWLKVTGREADPTYAASERIEGKFTTYGFFFRGLHFVLRAAEIAPVPEPAADTLTMWRGDPNEKREFPLAGEPVSCPDCRTKHRAHLCEEVRDRAPVDAIESLDRALDRGGIASVRFDSPRVSARARRVEQVQKLISLWKQVEAAPWPG